MSLGSVSFPASAAAAGFPPNVVPGLNFSLPDQ